MKYFNSYTQFTQYLSTQKNLKCVLDYSNNVTIKAVDGNKTIAKYIAIPTLDNIEYIKGVFNKASEYCEINYNSPDNWVNN